MFNILQEVVSKVTDTTSCTRSEKYSSKLGISRSFIRIFEINPEDTFTRCEKFSSKLDISRSFIRIFASGSNKIQIL